MDTVVWILIICFAVLLLVAFSKHLKFIFRFLFSAIFGFFALFLCNYLGLGIGANPATVLTVGLLGTPGFLGILALSLFL